jgi:hypothetical protein
LRIHRWDARIRTGQDDRLRSWKCFLGWLLTAEPRCGRGAGRVRTCPETGRAFSPRGCCMAPASRHRMSVDGRPPSRRLRAAFHARLASAGLPVQTGRLPIWVRVLTPTDTMPKPPCDRKRLDGVRPTPAETLHIPAVAGLVPLVETRRQRANRR